mgnify:CR=1 FL=1
MNTKLENKLFIKYPHLFPNGRKVDERKSLMLFGMEHDDGWFNLLDNTLGCIQNYVDNNKKDQPVVLQVKEKYGGIRIYLSPQDDMINGMIWLAEYISNHTCEQCGKSGLLKDMGYVKTLCEECYNEKQKERLENFKTRAKRSKKV